MYATVVSALFALSMSVSAQWPDRHGPTLDSHVAAEDAEGLPSAWSETENIAWKTPLHDEGHSSPVILEGKVWLTAATKDGKKQFVICIDEKTGKVLHDKLLFENKVVESLGGAKGYNNYAAPSCVLAPGAVYVHFGSYGTARLNPETAEVVWQRRDLPCRHYRGPGSSPVLVGDRLILTFDGVDQQYTTVLDAASGKTLWRTDRTTDYGDLDKNGQPKREGDLRKAYCTPGLATIGGQTQILSVGSRAMHSYDLADGKELWTLRHKNYNAGIRPLWLPGEKLAVINTGSRGAHLIAVKLKADTKGDITDSHIAWDRERGNPRFAKPIYYNGLIYQTTDIGAVSCIHAATGEELWKGRVQGNYRSSPILAGKHLYFFSEEGRGTILRTGREFKEIAVNQVPGMATTACPAVSRGAIFVRGKQHLYKIETR
ncbi:MAG: PQQ-binding-like beta-propeller repeat protein [Verrucomicrobiota bacterium]